MTPNVSGEFSAASEPMRILNIVAVHGTGSPLPGTQIEALMKGISSLEVAKEFQRIDAHDGKGADCVVYKTALFDARHPDGHTVKVRLWDANWADLEAAPSGGFRLVFFFARLLLSTTVYVGENTGLPGRLFHLLMSGILLWFPFLVALSLWNVVLSPMSRLAFAAVAIALAVLAWWMSRTVKGTCPIAERAGPWWAALFVATAAGQFLFDRPILDPALIPASPGSHWVVAGFVMSGPVLILWFLISELWRRPGGATPLKRKAATRAVLSMSGLLAVAFALLAGASALSLAANLAVAASYESMANRAAHWVTAYTAALPYNILPAEIIATSATVVAVLFFLAAFWRWRRDTRSGTAAALTSGAQFRWSMQRVILLILFIFFVAAGLILFDIADRAEHPTGVSRVINDISDWISHETGLEKHPMGAGGLFWIYALSASRLAVLGGLATRYASVALDHMADVLLYLRRKENQQRKLDRAIRCCNSSLPDGVPASTVLAAHSQGSRIAVDIARNPELRITRLATLGSPVASLYGSFLDAGGTDPWTSRALTQGKIEQPESDSPEPGPEILWINFWRGSDFVGGEIREGPNFDKEITVEIAKNHSDYWSDPDVLRFLLWGTIPPKARTLSNPGGPHP